MTKTFLTPLKRVRRELDKSLEELAVLFGTTRPNLSKIERDKQQASRELAEKIVTELRKLGLPPGFEDFSELHVMYPKRYMAKKSTRMRKAA